MSKYASTEYDKDARIKYIVLTKRIIKNASRNSILSADLELAHYVADFLFHDHLKPFISGNIALGWSAFAPSDVSNNIAIGHHAVSSNINGSNNIIIGYNVPMPYDATYNSTYNSTRNAIEYNTTGYNITELIQKSPNKKKKKKKNVVITKTAANILNTRLFRSQHYNEQLSYIFKSKLCKDPEINYPIVLSRHQPTPHKYETRYCYKTNKQRPTDECQEFEFHDKFVKILFIRRLLEKYTSYADLSATLELTHYIMPFIDCVEIIFIGGAVNFLLISDGVDSLRYST